MLILGRRPLRMRGFTIIELMIVIVVMGLLMMIGLPTMTLMLKNGQVRTAAESAIAGLQTARNEAIRRNTAVRFYLTSDTTSGCTLSNTGTSWVVSLTDPTAAGSKCATAPIDPSTDPAAGNPGIIQTRSGTEGTTKATVSGVHLCCKKCADAAIAAVKNVSGITKHDIVAKSESFMVEGEFTKAELAAALNAEGLAGDIR